AGAGRAQPVERLRAGGAQGRADAGQRRLQRDAAGAGAAEGAGGPLLRRRDGDGRGCHAANQSPGAARAAARPDEPGRRPVAAGGGLMSLPMRVLTALRSALYLVYLAVTVIPYAIAVLGWSWLPQTQRYWLTIGWPRIAVWGARWICGIRWRVEGWENL